jgi:hypothetical protein
MQRAGSREGGAEAWLCRAVAGTCCWRWTWSPAIWRDHRPERSRLAGPDTLRAGNVVAGSQAAALVTQASGLDQLGFGHRVQPVAVEVT